MAERKDHPTAEKKKWSFFRIIDGSFLGGDLLRGQYKLMFLTVALMLVYIANHYVMQQKLTRIDHLKKELEEVRYEALLQQSYLMRESRQSHIEELVKERGLDVEVAAQPPYSLEVKPERRGWK